MRQCPAGHAVGLVVARLIYPRSVHQEDDPGVIVCWRCNSYRRAGGEHWHRIDLERHEDEWESERDEHEGRRRRRKRRRR